MSGWNDGWGDDPQDAAQSWPLSPSRGNENSMPCRYFRQGKCFQGDACRYLHQPPRTKVAISQRPRAGPNADYSHGSRQPQNMGRSQGSKARECTYFFQGNCRYGDKCFFRHTHVENNRSLSTKNNPEPCLYHLQGRCTKGESCTFSHPSVSRPFHSDSQYGRNRFVTSNANSPVAFDAPSEPCQLYPEGKCGRGDWCPFVHEAPILDHVIPIDRRFSGVCWLCVPGRCPRGTACPSCHGRDKLCHCETTINSWRSTCQFHGAGMCYRGDECPFQHPQPESNPPVGDILSHLDGSPILSGRDTSPRQHPSTTTANLPVPPPANTDPSHEQYWRPTSDNGAHDAENNDTYTHLIPHQHTGVERNGDTHPTWPSENPPIVEPSANTEFVNEPKICKLFEQGSCMQGAACRDMHDNPAWYDTNIDEPLNDWHSSPIAPVLPNEYESGDPAESPPPQECTVERCLFSSDVQFGQGAAVRGVTTAFESRHLILSNLPPNVQEGDIKDLAEAFGDIVRVIIEPSVSLSTGALIEFADHAGAARAAQKLHNKEYKSAVVTARLDLPDGRHLGQEETPLVKISWPTPSIRGWAHYPSVSVAKEQANMLNGRMLGVRKITTTYQPAKKSQTHSFTVELKGLPLSTTRKDIQEFCPGSSSVSPAAHPNYDRNSSIQQIRELIADYKPIESFEVLPAGTSNTRIIAIVQFRDAKSVTAIVENLNRTRQETIKGNTLWVERIYSTKYSMPTYQFTHLKADLDRLRDSHEKECKIRYHDQDEEGQSINPVRIYMYGTDSKSVGQAMKKLETLLCGKPLVLEDNETWDDHFDTPEGAQFFTTLNTDAKFFVKCDRRMRALRYFGQDAPLGEAKDLILRQLKLIRGRYHSIPISRDIIRPLLSSGLRSICDDDGIDAVLDAVKQTLIVRGDGRDVKKVKRVLADLTPSSLGAWRPVTESNVPCSVCFCEAVDSVEIPCRHVYCKICFGHLLRSAIVPDFHDVRCVAEKGFHSEAIVPCDATIPFDIIRDILSPTEETKLLKHSFLSYLRDHPDVFYFCPTPDCEVVYRQSDTGTVLRCPLCGVKTCSTCNVRFHEGLTCDEYQNI